MIKIFGSWIDVIVIDCKLSSLYDWECWPYDYQVGSIMLTDCQVISSNSL